MLLLPLPLQVGQDVLRCVRAQVAKYLDASKLAAACKQKQLQEVGGCSDSDARLGHNNSSLSVCICISVSLY